MRALLEKVQDSPFYANKLKSKDTFTSLKEVPFTTKDILKIKGGQEAAVLPMPDIKWGQVPAAFVVLKESHQQIDELEIKEYLKTKLLVNLP
ncbi:AMP-binding enzyme [Halalkalibacter urbisdiaboli]|uniref:AMP-binding enzyme n=1 Tax=Halalkalibacter urbisdiaboli TaxID=1960589 RepID=UPI000B436503|nr:hypothetical protein [Halalkalibacter urbisdiaboli]